MAEVLDLMTQNLPHDIRVAVRNGWN